MAEQRPLFRRRSLHVVIVLLVFYPIGVYIYSQSVNRATTREIVTKNIDEGVEYCLALKAATEKVLTAPKDEPPKADWLRERLGREETIRLQGELRQRAHGSGATDALICFTEFREGDNVFLHWGQQRPEHVVADIHVERPIDPIAIREQLYEVTAGGSAEGVCAISLPLDLGDEKPRRMVVGLVSLNIGSQLGTLAQRLNFRALRLSLVGTALLALLAAYIVYLNERTRELELRLEEEKRLAYVGTIAAGMAHEIRNPLSSVKMNIQMIEDKLADCDEAQNGYVVGKVARIHGETARLEEAVNNFLAFARPKPLERRWAELNEAIGNVVEFLEPACVQENIQLVRDLTLDLPAAYIDPEQLGQALENLVRNAHQAVAEGGVVEVYTGRRGQRRRPRHPGRSAGEGVRHLLHDERGRQRARADDCQTDRRGPRRRRVPQEHRRQRHHVHDPLPD